MVVTLTVAVPEIWDILEIQKNENLLRSPKFYGENEFPVEMCISQVSKSSHSNQDEPDFTHAL